MRGPDPLHWTMTPGKDMAVNRATPRSDTGEALAVDSFSISYRVEGRLVPAVSDVTFSLRRSERMAIVGESGSGKTTLATAIAGLFSEETASVEYRSARIAGRDTDLRTSRAVIPSSQEGVSMIFQDAMTSLDPVASIAHQFRTVLTAQSRQSAKRMRKESLEWLDRVGIPHPARVLKLRPYELSGGMRQRVMIALALCSRPAVLIADEPTSALDVAVSQRIMALMLELTAELGTAVIAITHDIDLARRYMDRTLVLKDGIVQDVCATQELTSSSRSDYTRELLRCVPRLRDYAKDQLPTLVLDTHRDSEAGS